MSTQTVRQLAQSMRHAADFLDTLPEDFLVDDEALCIEDDGDIALEWSTRKRCSAGVSFSPSGQFSWVGLMHQERASGKFAGCNVRYWIGRVQEEMKP